MESRNIGATEKTCDYARNYLSVIGLSRVRGLRIAVDHFGSASADFRGTERGPDEGQMMTFSHTTISTFPTLPVPKGDRCLASPTLTFLSPFNS